MKLSPIIQGVPILSVDIFRGEKGPIGKHCLLWAFFYFNDLKFLSIVRKLPIQKIAYFKVNKKKLWEQKMCAKLRAT